MRRERAASARSSATLTRRGKYLWLPLTGRQPRRGGLLLHLGMSGSLALHERAPPPGPHDHFDLVTTQGTLRLTDPRRFGAVLWSRAHRRRAGAPAAAPASVPSPSTRRLTPQALHAACSGAACSIKTVLLAGEVVVGAGNIYACEALFRAGIDPRTRCDRLSRRAASGCWRRCARRWRGRSTLGGSTLRDFRDAHGVAGEFQAEARVYGREAQPCLRCGTPVRRIVQAQRSTLLLPALPAPAEPHHRAADAPRPRRLRTVWRHRPHELLVSRCFAAGWRRGLR